MAKRIVVTALVLAMFAAGQFVMAKGEAPLGSEERPIVWAFVPSGETARVSAGAQSVADLLHAKTGLFFKTLVATEYAGVIEALRSNPPTAQMSSLATFAYVMAADMGVCGAALVSVRNGSAFYNGQIITRPDTGIKKLADLKGKSFARVDAISTSGWIIPMITLKAAGIDPTRDIKVVDAGSHPAVVSAVYSGDVDAGACFVDARTLIQKDHPDVMEKVVVLLKSANIPNDGVQFNPSVPQELQDKIVNALLEIAQTEDGKKAINTAYQWTALERHDDSFYDPFRQVLQAAGVEAAELLPKPKK
jgi:phosphonate transport system substrate-binding protein